MLTGNDLAIDKPWSQVETNLAYGNNIKNAHLIIGGSKGDVGIIMTLTLGLLMVLKLKGSINGCKIMFSGNLF